MGFALPEGLKFWKVQIQSYKANKFYIEHRGWKMWFINIPKLYYITIYKVDTTSKGVDS